MGVIRKQSINFSIVNFVGVLIGTLSTLFIYPLAREAYGLARFFIDLSWLMYPLVLFGMDAVSLKYFPKYKNHPGTGKSFLTFLLTNVVVISLMFAGIAWLYGRDVTAWLDRYAGMRFEEDPLIDQFLWLAVPLAFLMGVAMLFNRFFSSFHRILFPAILQNLIKVTLPVFILLLFYSIIGIEWIPYSVLGTYILVLICYLLYLRLTGELVFSFDFKGYSGRKYREILQFSLFSMFSSLGALIAFRIDTVMVGTLLNLDLTGEYGIASTIAQTIAIPTNAIITVAAPVISMAWANNNIDEIRSVYKKASTNLLVVGLLIYTGMWACTHHLFAIMPNSEQFEGAIYVVLILGFAKIIDMATSVNNEIIAYSRFYRFQFLCGCYFGGSEYRVKPDLNQPVWNHWCGDGYRNLPVVIQHVESCFYLYQIGYPSFFRRYGKTDRHSIVYLCSRILVAVVGFRFVGSAHKEWGYFPYFCGVDHLLESIS
jgi:O-antigen/teichoic acid export membrane protein